MDISFLKVDIRFLKPGVQIFKSGVHFNKRADGFFFLQGVSEIRMRLFCIICRYKFILLDILCKRYVYLFIVFSR